MDNSIAIMIKAFQFIPIFLLLFSFSSCDRHDYYHLKMELDRADGLYKEAGVWALGMQIGEVKEIEIKDGKVLVTLAINKETGITDKAIFRIADSDLMGTKSVYVDSIHAGTEMLKDGALVSVKL